MAEEHSAGTNPGDSSGVRILPPVIYLAGLAAGFFLQRAWPVPIGPPTVEPAIRTGGWVLLVIWLFLSIWAIATFRRAGTTPNPTRPTTTLALGGPYRWTRNPMYLAFALMQAGAALIANALWPLVWLLPVLLVIRLHVIGREERYLERKFGEDYRAYKRRVRRWF
jgi:protein-S-isoprenylcysteine O-methyltransferase Ste14